MTVANEHEHKVSFTEDVFFPAHPPRTESATFRATKRKGHAAQIPCAISGHVDGAEYHHVFCEWAFANAVDWRVVKGVATGEITRLPVLDLKTDQPTGETYDARHSLLWVIVKLAEVRGFDWHAFDAARPESFIDSPQNMLVLNEKFHRAIFHGIHTLSMPAWICQAYPRVDGFVFTKDEKA